MTNKTWFIGLSMLAASVGARADILTLGSSSKQVAGVKVYDTAKTAVTGQPSFDLTEKAAALRQKTVVIITKDVYVAQLLVSDAAAYDAVKATACKSHTAGAQLKSLDTQKAIAVRLDFKYPVTASQFDSAFRDSFNSNKVDWNAPAITQFLNAVNAGGDVTPGSSWTIVIQKGAKDVLTFQDTKGKLTTVTDANLMTRIMSLWMGESVSGDSGLQNFINNFLCGN